MSPTVVAASCMALGAVAELTGIGLGWRELRGRGRLLHEFTAGTTPVTVSVGLAWGHEQALPVTPEPLTDRQRIDMLLGRVEDLRAEVVARQQDTEQRMGEAIRRQVSDTETNLSARVVKLRDLVVGTSDGGRQARIALAVLVVGVLLQTVGNFISLA